MLLIEANYIKLWSVVGTTMPISALDCIGSCIDLSIDIIDLAHTRCSCLFSFLQVKEKLQMDPQLDRRKL